MTTSIYRGACDASAATRIGRTDLFVAASDEDFVLRVYDRSAPGGPVATIDVTSFLAPADLGKEPDIEGAAAIGDRVYWIGSHGRDKNAVEQESRQRLFATRIQAAGQSASITPVGRPYRHLLRDLARAPDLAPLDLAHAATMAPEAPGGLNIEGMAPTADGALLFGFRNPIPQGRALVVRLHNPAALVDGRAEAAVLTLAGALDLGGRGIRAMEFVEASGLYVLLAGAFDDTRDFRLFLWSGAGGDAAVPLDADALLELNPEEMIVTPEGGGLYTFEVFSDDGDVVVGEKKCKRLKERARQSFRSLRFEVAVTA